MRKFEYNILRITNPTDFQLLIKQLDESGRSGWELISIIPLPNNPITQLPSNLIQLFFKREVFDNQEEVL